MRGAATRTRRTCHGLWAALFLALAPPPAAAEESCDTLGGLIALGAAAVSAGRQAGDGDDRARLSAMARQVDRAAVERALARMELDRFSADVSAFLSRAADGAAIDAARLSQIDSLLRMACPEAGAGGIASESGRLRMGTRLRAVDVVYAEEPWSTEGILRDASRALGLVAAVAAAVGLLWLCRLGYDWVFALIFVRHYCRIHATVLIDRTPVHGLITILGRRGCRFIPDDAVGAGRLLGTPPHAGAGVIIAEQRLAATIDDVLDEFAVIRFVETQTEDRIHHLLRRSATPPRLARKRAPRRGRRARRELRTKRAAGAARAQA